MNGRDKPDDAGAGAPGRTARGRARGFEDALRGTAWESRRGALRGMFEEIASGYDRLNRLLSLGLDIGWRRWAARSLADRPPGAVLDLASGTGDLAVALARAGAGPLVRSDLSAPLLLLGGSKLARRRLPAHAVACEMDHLPFRDASLAAVAQGFALRHCRTYEGFFAELFRVVRPGAPIALLDMRYPSGSGFAAAYRLYFRRILPRLAALLGGDRRAYDMMVDSVIGLPPEAELEAHLRAAGFEEVRSEPGIFGSVRLLTARRPSA